MNEEVKYPNGLVSYLETHFEVVSAIQRALDEDGNVVSEHHDEYGTAGLYELAMKWTNEFEEKYVNIEWGAELEFFDELEAFIETKFK